MSCRPFGRVEPRSDLADRIGQGDDLAHGGGETLEARRVEPEAVEQAVAQAVLAAVREVELVRGEDARGRPLDGDGDRVEAGILLVRRRLRERDRRGAGGAELVVERQGGDGLRHAREFTAARPVRGRSRDVSA